jgi:hypothetical protein
VPGTLSIANVRHVSGGNQVAVLTADATVWELNVSGCNNNETMMVQVQNGATLTTFSGVNLEPSGVIELQNGTLDAQYVEVLGGTLRGSGTVITGSGPIPGQVENRDGVVAPGNGIGTLSVFGRFANGTAGTLAMELGGTMAGMQYDQLVVNGAVATGGTLAVSLTDSGGGPFQPSIGNSFTLITATEGVGGMFDQLSLPAGYHWNVEYGLTSVILSVVGLGLAGDYNGNGLVDAADYAVWRDSLGDMGSSLAADGNGDQVVDQNDYLVWRGNFGKSALGGGSVTVAVAAVPELSSMVLWVLAVPAGIFWTRRNHQRPS